MMEIYCSITRLPGTICFVWQWFVRIGQLEALIGANIGQEIRSRTTRNYALTYSEWHFKHDGDLTSSWEGMIMSNANIHQVMHW